MWRLNKQNWCDYCVWLVWYWIIYTCRRWERHELQHFMLSGGSKSDNNRSFSHNVISKRTMTTVDQDCESNNSGAILAASETVTTESRIGAQHRATASTNKHLMLINHRFTADRFIFILYILLLFVHFVCMFLSLSLCLSLRVSLSVSFYRLIVYRRFENSEKWWTQTANRIVFTTRRTRARHTHQTAAANWWVNLGDSVGLIKLSK